MGSRLIRIYDDARCIAADSYSRTRTQLLAALLLDYRKRYM